MTEAPLLTLFVCGVKATPCTSPGCARPSATACTYELGGRKAGQRCGRALCHQHAVVVDAEHILCPPHEHARLTALAVVAGWEPRR
jgi:hypothetical protein